jgi:hypothetical protein
LRLGLFGALQEQIDIRTERSPPRLLVRGELGRYAASQTTVSRNRATTGGGVDNSGLGRAELDYSTLNDPADGGIVNMLHTADHNYLLLVRVTKQFKRLRCTPGL